MNLVTGKKSNAHVSSDDFRKIVESLVGGGGSFVSSVGTGLQTSVSGTTLSIGKGMIVHHGCVFETSNSGDTVSFQAGSSGMNRIDLICVKYTRNNTTGIEDAAWNVLQGTATSGTPVQPTVPSGDLRDDNATQDYCPVFKLTLTGNTPTVQLLLNTIPIDDAYHKPSAGIPKTDLVSTVQASLNLADSACQIDLLWETSTPTSSFSAGSITVQNISNYEKIILVSRFSTSNERTFVEIIDEYGSYTSKIWHESYLRTVCRPCTLTATGIQFGSCTYSSNSFSYSAGDDHLIPYKVYGAKGVS